MDASPSSALPPCSEPCSPPSPTMSANEPRYHHIPPLCTVYILPLHAPLPVSPPTVCFSCVFPSRSDGVRGAPGALACIQPGEAGARHRKRLCSARIQPGEAGGQHRKRLCSAPPGNHDSLCEEWHVQVCGFFLHVFFIILQFLVCKQR